jgi:hypothetical protein
VVCAPRQGDGAATVVDPTGCRLKIPSWMVSPAAAGATLVEQAVLSAAALLSVAGLIATDLALHTPGSSPSTDSLSQTGHSPGKGDSHAAASTRARSGTEDRATDSPRPRGAGGAGGSASGGHRCGAQRRQQE